MDTQDQQPKLVNATCSQCGYTRFTHDPDALCYPCTIEAAVARITPQLQEEIDALIRQDRKIEAVRLIKETLAISLLTAKAIIAEWWGLEIDQR
jgi:hypothetical protein